MMRTLFPRQSDRCWLPLDKPKLSDVSKARLRAVGLNRILQRSSAFLQAPHSRCWWCLPFHGFSKVGCKSSVPNIHFLQCLFLLMTYWNWSLACRLIIPRCWDFPSPISQPSVLSFLTLSFFLRFRFLLLVRPRINWTSGRSRWRSVEWWN